MSWSYYFSHTFGRSLYPLDLKCIKSLFRLLSGKRQLRAICPFRHYHVSSELGVKSPFPVLSIMPFPFAHFTISRPRDLGKTAFVPSFTRLEDQMRIKPIRLTKKFPLLKILPRTQTKCRPLVAICENFYIIHFWIKQINSSCFAGTFTQFIRRIRCLYSLLKTEKKLLNLNSLEDWRHNFAI
jgi:hypothetical protein